MGGIYGRYAYAQEAFIYFTTEDLKIAEVPVHVKYFKDRKSRVAGNLFRYCKKTVSIVLSLCLKKSGDRER